jgi:hypothetical protein
MISPANYHQKNACFSNTPFKNAHKTAKNSHQQSSIIFVKFNPPEALPSRE